jgi:hypothetical protein
MYSVQAVVVDFAMFILLFLLFIYHKQYNSPRCELGAVG